MRSVHVATLVTSVAVVGSLVAGCGGGNQTPSEDAGRPELRTGNPGKGQPATSAAERAAAAEKAIASDPSASQWTFGAPVTLTERTPIATIAADPASFAGQRVSVEGTVSKVCQASGCWAEIQAADGSTILVTSPDESVLLPKNCVGQRVVVEGKVPPAAQGEEVEAKLTLDAVQLTRATG